MAPGLRGGWGGHTPELLVSGLGFRVSDPPAPLPPPTSLEIKGAYIPYYHKGGLYTLLKINKGAYNYLEGHGSSRYKLTKTIRVLVTPVMFRL